MTLTRKVFQLKVKHYKKCKALSTLISQLFLNQIPPDLACNILILKIFNLGHVTFVQGHIFVYDDTPFIS